MYYKLTDNVYWGDHTSIYGLRDVVGSVICLAHNREMTSDTYSPLVLPASTPYFKMSERDRSFPCDTYFETMYYVIKSFKNSYLPILVHCYAGIHRSPIIAIMAEIIIERNDEEYYQSLLNIVSSTIPEFKKTRFFNYSSAAQIWIKKRLLSTSPQKYSRGPAGSSCILDCCEYS